MRTRKVFSFLAILTALLLAETSFGQTSQGRISGRVIDASGGVVAGATVTIVNLGTQVKRALETNASGDYVAPAIEPGFYSVTVEAPGFSKVVRGRVQVEVANDIKLDFQLKPGQVSETIEVKEEAPLTESSNAVLSGVLSNKAINELPVQGRDFQNLLNLHPGVQRTAGGGFHSTTSNGLRPDDNNYIIDGANDNDAYWGETVVNDAGILGTPASMLPLDSIQEFNTQEQPQADYGAKPGVVVNMGIKSGTNSIHGTAYYFHRNAAFDARNYFNPKPQPTSALLLHQFGASAGGPILKDKWFYFANYEGVRSKVGNPANVFSPVTNSLATPGNPAGDAESSIVDAIHSLGCDTTPANCSPLSLNLVKLLPTNPGFTADPNDPTVINFDFNNQNRTDSLVLKSDYHVNQRHTITGRFIYANASQTEEDAFPLRKEWLSHADPITQVLGIDWNWIPNSRWVNTARFSYNIFDEKIAPVDASVNPRDYGLNTGITDPRLFGFPRINISTTCCNYLGGNSSWPTYTSPSHTENYSDTVSYTAGKHTVRFGGIFSNGGVDYYRANTGRGRIDFRHLTSFLEGTVRSWRLLYGDPARNITMKSWGLFAQDDFRATRHITLNLGLRYDVVYPIKDSQDRLANYVPSQGIVQVGHGIREPYQTNYKNFSPRLGAAWDIFGTGKTVVRSGFGMIYVQPSIRTFVFSSGGLNLNPSGLKKILPDGTVIPSNGTITSFLLQGASPGLIKWDTTGPIFPVNDPSLNVCSFDSACSIFAVDQHLKTPYVLNWNLNIQQALTPSTVLQVAYVANHGVKLYSTIDLNQVNPAVDDGSEQTGRPLVQNCPASLGGAGLGGPCFPYISFLNFLGNKSTSTYHSLQVTFTKRSSKGLYLLAGYTYGHGIDTAGNTSNLGFAPQDSLNYNAEKASSDYDIRHRLTFSATYDLPSHKVWAQMLEGWQVTSIAQWETGPPVLFFDNFNDLTGTGEGPGNGNNDRWNILGSPKNLKWSASGAIPFLANTYDSGGNVLTRDPICAGVANTQGLLDALDFAGGCFAQNGTIIYPNAFFTFGNMGRNIFRGPGFVNWDASVAKVWRLNERMKMQFRGEVFNLLNHPNFSPSSIGGDLTSPGSLGRVSETPDVWAANPVVGSGGSRHIQLGLKLIW
jgi:carboxypeptidase family protein/TonB-dependent receptor-like protein